MPGELPQKDNEEKQEYENKPHHNWASHAASALATLCLGLKDTTAERVPNFYQTTFDPMTYDKTGAYESEFGDDPNGADIDRYPFYGGDVLEGQDRLR